MKQSMIYVSLAASLMLTGCGGGSSSGSKPSPSPTPTSASQITLEVHHTVQDASKLHAQLSSGAHALAAVVGVGNSIPTGETFTVFDQKDRTVIHSSTTKGDDKAAIETISFDVPSSKQMDLFTITALDKYQSKKDNRYVCSYDTTKTTSKSTQTIDFSKKQQHTVDFYYNCKLSSNPPVPESSVTYTLSTPAGGSKETYDFSIQAGNVDIAEVSFYSSQKIDHEGLNPKKFTIGNMTYYKYDYKTNSEDTITNFSLSKLNYGDDSWANEPNAPGANKPDAWERNYNDHVTGFIRGVQVRLKGQTSFERAKFKKQSGQSQKALYSTTSPDSSDPKSPSSWIGDYYADWAVYSHGEFNTSKVPLSYINALTYGFMGINPATATVTDLDPWGDLYPAAGKQKGVNIPALAYFAMERQLSPIGADGQHTLNYILSFGGWGTVLTYDSNSSPMVHKNDNFTSGDFSVLFKENDHDAKIQKMADSMVDAMFRAGANGVDIDYEWTGPVETVPARFQKAGLSAPLCKATVPAGYQPNTCLPQDLDAYEADGYVTLLKDVRADLNQLHKTTNEKYYLTTALMAGKPQLQAMNAIHGDLKSALTAVDKVNLMTYDMHGGFDAPLSGQQPKNTNITGLASQVKVDSDSPNSDEMSITKSLNYIESIIGSTAVKDKIVLGIPAYGHILKTVPGDSHQNGLFAQLANADDQATSQDDYGEFTGDVWYQNKTGDDINNSVDLASENALNGIRGSETYDYRCIVDSTQCATGNGPTPADLFSSDEHYVHPVDQLPWYFNQTKSLFLTYDDQDSTAYKINHVVKSTSLPLAGAFIWEADSDLGKDNPAFQSKSIIYAISSNLIKTDSSNR